MRQQLATAQEWIQRHVPGYRLRTVALPMGAYPKELRWAISGEAKGKTYTARRHPDGGRRRRALAVRASPSIRYHLPRIQAVERSCAYWLTYFDRNPQERYVSDGDPAVITVAPGRPRQGAAIPGSESGRSGSRRERGLLVDEIRRAPLEKAGADQLPPSFRRARESPRRRAHIVERFTKRFWMAAARNCAG